MTEEGPATAPLLLELWSDEDCTVCGLGNAFASARGYEVCARCGWVDDPAAYVQPDRQSETNDDSLNEARRNWPMRLCDRLIGAPLSTFAIALRDDTIGGYEYVVDGASLRTIFRPWDMKASIGPWPLVREWPSALATGARQTPTGRTRLYVCHSCGGDDYERCVTADVHVSEDRVIWSRIGLETYDDERHGWYLDMRSGPAGFAFDTREYRRALLDAQRAQP